MCRRTHFRLQNLQSKSVHTPMSSWSGCLGVEGCMVRVGRGVSGKE